MFGMVFPHVMELLLESQTQHSAALTALAVHGEKAPPLQKAATATYQGSASPTPEPAVVHRTQVSFRDGHREHPAPIRGSAAVGSGQRERKLDQLSHGLVWGER